MAASENRAVAASSSSSSEALERFERGELTLDEYLEDRVARAASRLAGQVSEEVLELVRETLREQVRADPVFRALVRRTTGREPV